jgi:RNA polymerase sigma factor (sigma-70 family)
MAGSTDPELLMRVAALRDDPAWSLFFERYDPLVRSWCKGYGFDAASADELHQRVWVELARRMPAYHYDPGGSFRGWLRRLCRHRAVDLLRERRKSALFPLTDDELIDPVGMAARVADGEPDDEAAGRRLLLLQEAAEAQEEVRRRVKPVRWDVFWRVVIEGEPMTETAAALGLKYATVYAAARHVSELLRAEGRRRKERLGVADAPSPDEEPTP